MIHNFQSFDFDWLRVMIDDKVIGDRDVLEPIGATARMMRMATTHANWLDGYCETKWINGTWELTFYRPESATAPKYIPEPVRGNSK